MEKNASSRGLAEAPTASYDFSTAQAPQLQSWTLKVGKDGRLVVPAAARALMELGSDGEVTAYVKEGVLHVISPNAALTRIREILKPYRSETHSIVDEFISEKRLEVAREEAEY